LVPADQELASIETGTLVTDALATMARSGFDQLPVTHDRTVVGVFSYRSFAQNLGIVRRQDDPLSYPVDDFLEDLAFVRPTSDVEEALRALDEKGAVLVGDEDNLLAVVTPTDLNTFLWNASRQFMILREIELATRYLFRCACASDDELRSLVAVARPPGGDGVGVERLEDLTFSELIAVINGPERFGRVFSRTFGRSRELVFSLLEPVREVRNKVFHFRDVVTSDEIDLVMNARVWLQRRVRMVR
jgi:hypothetical protein